METFQIFDTFVERFLNEINKKNRSYLITLTQLCECKKEKMKKKNVTTRKPYKRIEMFYKTL